MSVNWSLNRTLFISVVFLLSFSSCRKERLKDDKEFLIGNWEWVYSVRETPCGCHSGTSQFDSLTPLTEGNTYSMEFNKKGKIFFYKNDEIINKKRIVFYKWPNGQWLKSFDDARSFAIKLNNNKDSILGGNISAEGDISEIDSVFFGTYFPFKKEYKRGLSIFYRHLFIKR